MRKFAHRAGCVCAACVITSHAFGHDGITPNAGPVYVGMTWPDGTDGHVPHEDHRQFKQNPWGWIASGATSSMTTSQRYVAPFEPERLEDGIIRLYIPGTLTAEDIEE